MSSCLWFVIIFSTYFCRHRSTKTARPISTVCRPSSRSKLTFSTKKFALLTLIHTRIVLKSLITPTPIFTPIPECWNPSQINNLEWLYWTVNNKVLSNQIRECESQIRTIRWRQFRPRAPHIANGSVCPLTKECWQLLKWPKYKVDIRRMQKRNHE